MSETTQKKVCSPNKGCGIEKDVSEFNKDRGYYSYICKECKKNHRQNNKHKISEKNRLYRENNKEYYKNWRDVNKEKYKQYRETDRTKGLAKKRHERYRHNNKEKLLLSRSKYRAKQKGIEHNIILEDIQIPEYCPVLGIKLERNINARAAHDNSPSLDRIDNNKGYIKGNVMVISYRANKIKNNATPEELQKVLDYMKGCENDKQI